VTLTCLIDGTSIIDRMGGYSIEPETEQPLGIFGMSCHIEKRDIENVLNMEVRGQ